MTALDFDVMTLESGAPGATTLVLRTQAPWVPGLPARAFIVSAGDLARRRPLTGIDLIANDRVALPSGGTGRLHTLTLDGRSGNLQTVHEADLRAAFPHGVHNLARAAANGLLDLLRALPRDMPSAACHGKLASLGGDAYAIRVVAELTPAHPAPTPRRRPQGTWL